MKAISVKQPWAWALLHGKPVENRTWCTNHRGPTVIHASKSFDRHGLLWLHQHRHLLDALIPHPDSFSRGGIVGIADLVSVVDQHDSPFFFGPFGFEFTQAQEVEFKPWRGKLGFFDIPDNLVPQPQELPHGQSKLTW